MSTLEKTIDRAVAELPAGWTMKINIESGNAWVVLYDGKGGHAIMSCDGSLAKQMTEAIAYAHEHS